MRSEEINPSPRTQRWRREVPIPHRSRAGRGGVRQSSPFWEPLGPLGRTAQRWLKWLFIQATPGAKHPGLLTKWKLLTSHVMSREVSDSYKVDIEKYRPGKLRQAVIPLENHLGLRSTLLREKHRVCVMGKPLGNIDNNSFLCFPSRQCYMND